MYAASTATLNVSDATIIATETTGTTRGFSITAGGYANIENCTITATTDNAKSYGIYNSGTTVVSNCTINAYSNYSVSSNLSQGILNYYNAEITVNDCYVYGTHSGIQNAGTLYVNGGTYKGYGHGGIYFSGEGTTSYVRNAKLTEADMPDGYIANDETSPCNHAGFYIGGNNNITVYMDNCDIYGADSPFVIRESADQQFSTLHISNSTVNTIPFSFANFSI